MTRVPRAMGFQPKDGHVKNASILTFVVLFVLSATLAAQMVRPKQPAGGGGNSSGSGSGKDGNGTKDAKKIAELAADALVAKWKDAKTLEVTGTIKNMTPVAYAGARTAKLTCTGKDGKSETLKEQAIPAMGASGSSNFKIELTDKKYFDKDLKWTLEISPGDATASNDKKGPMTLDPGTQPKS
jgi:hypothetical protein